MRIKPTEEQDHILELGAKRLHLVIQAMAGTGKTSTLEMLSKVLSGRGLYLAYNTSIAKEAKRRFGTKIDCKTMHGLAFMHFGHRYVDRLEGEQNGKLTAHRILGYLTLKPIGNLGALSQASIIKATLENYFHSNDDLVEIQHVPIIPLAHLADPGSHEFTYIAQEIIHQTRQLWEMHWLDKSPLPISHDSYLKAFCLTKPTLKYDYIALDEGQDANALILGLLTRQKCQLIAVGDSFQQIYEYRGAINALDKIPDATTCYLSQSFRFGDNIAKQANLILGNLNAKIPIRGYNIDRMDLSGPKAYLFRSNMGMFSELLSRTFIKKEQCHITGGAQDVVALLNGITDLYDGKPSSHPDLAGFTTWRAYRHASEQDGAPQEMQQLVKIVHSYPRKKLMYALRLASKTPESKAQAILSTAHKAKGREYPDVVMGPDFKAPSPHINDVMEPFEPEEARISYVALTRAQRSVRGADKILMSYRLRLGNLAKQQEVLQQQLKSYSHLADKLSKLPAHRQQEEIRKLSPEQKKKLNQYLKSNG